MAPPRLGQLARAGGGIARIVFNFRYLKLTAFAASIILAYLLFNSMDAESFLAAHYELRNAAAFISGILYAFGFTAPFGAGVFILLNPPTGEVLKLGVTGGLGAVAADYILFKFVRLSFNDEFDALKTTPAIRTAHLKFKAFLPEKVREYTLLALAGIFIASPLPDEIGVSLLAGFTDLKEGQLALLSFALNTAGILVLLAI